MNSDSDQTVVPAAEGEQARSEEAAAWEDPSDLSIGAGPGESLESDKVVVIYSAGSESEANVVRGVLQASGIPVAYDSLPSPTMGHVFSVSESSWGDIVVPVEYADAARKALAEAEQAGRELDTAENEENSGTP